MLLNFMALICPKLDLSNETMMVILYDYYGETILSDFYSSEKKNTQYTYAQITLILTLSSKSMLKVLLSWEVKCQLYCLYAQY